MNVGNEHSRSLWMSKAPVAEALPLAADAEADVVVVGSGIAGLSTAYELARLGRSVIVIDRGGIGSGMTARTTAHLASELDDYYHELIHARGLLLQLDCPDLAMERVRFFQHQSLDEFLRAAALHVEAINEATAGIPPDRIRLHVCWGNYDGPHVHDLPLEEVLPVVLGARVGALSLPLANPRHQHEYKVLRRYPLPEAMLFLPGVIDSTTNFVEHPEVVADRICQVVEAVGDRTRVIASVDCGFGTFAGSELVVESVVWAKLQALKEGATLATRRLWG